MATSCGAPCHIGQLLLAGQQIRAEHSICALGADIELPVWARCPVLSAAEQEQEDASAREEVQSLSLSLSLWPQRLA